MTRATEFPEDEPLSTESEERNEVPIEQTRERRPKGAPADDSRVSGIVEKLAFWRRIGDFYQGVKMELRKTSWPTRSEVQSTTLVVLIAVFFFGFYLWGVDKLVT